MGSATVTLEDGRTANIEYEGESPPSESEILSFMDSQGGDLSKPETIGPANPYGGLLGSAGSSISSTPKQNFLESAFAKVFGKEVPDVYKDSSGNRIQDIYDPSDEDGISQIPELDSQAGARKTATGMGVLSSFVPGLGQASKIKQGMGAIPKILEYGKLAGLTSATGIAADKASELKGDLPKTDLEQTANRFIDETAFGTIVPPALEGTFAGLHKTGKFLKDKLGSIIEPGRPAQIIPGATYAEKAKEIIPGVSYAERPPLRERGATYEAIPPSRDISKDIPARKSETIRGPSYEAKPAIIEEPQSRAFGDVVTAQDIDKSLVRRQIGADGTIEHKLDDAVAELQPVLELPPEQSLIALDKKQEKLIGDINTVIKKAEMSNPKSATVQFSNTEKYIETLPKGSKERAAAEEVLTAKKEELTNAWDGSVVDLQTWKTSNDRTHRNIYNKDSLTANEAIEGEVAKYISSDMRRSLEEAVPGIKELNAQLSKTYTVEPIVRRRFAQSTAEASATPKVISEATPAYSDVKFRKGGNASKLGPWNEGKPAYSELGKYLDKQPAYSEMPKITPSTPAYSELPTKIPAISQKIIPGPWQGKVDSALKVLEPILGAAVGSTMGPTGAVLGSAVGAARGQLGGGANVIGQAGGALAKLAGVLKNLVPPVAPGITRLAPNGFIPELSNSMAEELPEKLPRNSANFKADQLANFLMQTANSPQAPIAQALVQKLQQAVQAQDMDKVERLHADMARVFPDLFEQGTGVNGKVFYPDEQTKIMENLRQLHRQGQVDSIQLAKQRNAFMNPMDSRILPVERKKQAQSSGPNQMVNGTRTYAY
jgi:hypothetical protein